MERERPVVSWENEETKAVVSWLEEDDNRVQLQRVVEAWNEMGLLGVDLADQIYLMTSRTIPRLASKRVNWNEVAEHFALEMVSVDEEELTRRRLALGGSE